MRYLKYFGYEVVDCATNEALEATNADCLLYPGDSEVDSTHNPKELADSGVEVQVKYTSGDSFGVKKVYGLHRDKGLELGTYRSTRPDPEDTAENLSNRKPSNQDVVYWEESDILTFPMDVLDPETECSRVPQRIVTDLKIPKAQRECTEAFDVFCFRWAGNPWMVASRPESILNSTPGKGLPVSTIWDTELIVAHDFTEDTCE